MSYAEQLFFQSSKFFCTRKNAVDESAVSAHSENAIFVRENICQEQLDVQIIQDTKGLRDGKIQGYKYVNFLNHLSRICANVWLIYV